MVKKKNNSNSEKILPIMLIGGLSIGGYFLYKYLKEDEVEKEGFVIISTPNFPTMAVVGSKVNITAIGKNIEEESFSCFMKIINQATGEILAPRQTANVGTGLTKEFSLEFIMPDVSFIRVEIQSGRIIDSEEKIDSRRPRTIEAKEDYPIEICRDPYCFIVNNQAEEIQMKEFLGIDPVGMDLDSYLEGATPEQLDYWKDGDGGVTFDGWINIWTSLHRQDIVEFVISKYNEYAGIVSAKINNFTITTI